MFHVLNNGIDIVVKELIEHTDSNIFDNPQQSVKRKKKLVIPLKVPYCI